MHSGPEQLKDWMRRREFDQRETAKYLGWDEAYVSMVVNGKRRPGLDNALWLEQMTGIPVEAWVLTDLHESEVVGAEKPGKRSSNKA